MLAAFLSFPTLNAYAGCCDNCDELPPSETSNDEMIKQPPNKQIQSVKPNARAIKKDKEIEKKVKEKLKEELGPDYTEKDLEKLRRDNTVHRKKNDNFCGTAKLNRLMREKMKARREKAMNASFYDYKLTNMEKQEIPMSSFKGKVVLIVNTATACGFTPQ